MTVVRVELDGWEPGSVPVELGPVRLPRGGGVLLDAYPWPDFVPSGRFPADGAALRLAARGVARVVVACPPLASPACSVLALAVGRLLVEQRLVAGAGAVPVVLCASRPRCAWESGGVIVPHPVTVHARGGVQYRVVWEISETSDVAAWLLRLGPVVGWPVAVPA
ncbi:hypothetical protein [Pseudofrankia asymbiotica]|uniref:Uncharacterized protein n=1 Tax=Pseudofrankia asymbiotica TaxID=1834516 RepID=A0A1V2I1D9_9ACTN|nr:hypothetical protein [Pseudofrankia asymbiotica]ONH23372.1 hypothetical protein BL253_33215 [Pseudofrankia asymbiotica]